MRTVSIPYLFQKPGSDVFYYRRKVPLALREKIGKEHILQSLQTTDPRVAQQRLSKLVKQTEILWSHLGNPSRSGNLKIALQYLKEIDLDPVVPEEAAVWAWEDQLQEQFGDGPLPEPQKTALEVVQGTRAFTLQDSLDQYKEARPNGIERAERAYRYLREYLGSDRELNKIRRTEVNGFVQFLLDKDMSTTSVQRYLAPLKASFSRAIRENELNLENVWSRVEIPEYGKDVQKREVFTVAERQLLLKAIDEHGPDTLRSILEVITETGARLAEIVGLSKDDLRLYEPIPYIQLKEHPWRTLKTPGSTRRIPLSDRARRSLVDAVSRSHDAVLVYPQYCTYEGCSADSASAAAVKWIRSREGLKGSKLGVHSLRHGMKDLLRSVKCPMEAADQIIGHSTPGMGANYGEGYSLEVLYEYVVAATK
jgi:site-specific recombinase XerD